MLLLGGFDESDALFSPPDADAVVVVGAGGGTPLSAADAFAAVVAFRAFFGCLPAVLLSNVMAVPSTPTIASVRGAPPAFPFSWRTEGASNETPSESSNDCE